MVTKKQISVQSNTHPLRYGGDVHSNILDQNNLGFLRNKTSPKTLKMNEKLKQKEEFQTADAAKQSLLCIRDQPPCSPKRERRNEMLNPSPKSVMIGNSADANAGAGLSISDTNYPFHDLVLRSDEINPSDHQMIIPYPSSLLMYARMCNFLENASGTDLIDLVGLSQFSLEGIINSNSPKQHFARSLLECVDDLSVEGFIEGKGSTKVIIFSTQKHRQFIIAFQGPPHLQVNLVTKGKLSQQQSDMGRRGISHLHSSNKVLAGNEYCSIYFAQNLEDRLFSILTRLSARHPFCDVVMIGHVFGASLATIASIRYAGMYPMMKVFCRCFGSPRVGGNDMRDLAHSLPNLNIVRIENGQDLNVNQPCENNWKHVGHTLTLTIENEDDQSEAQICAYRFDKMRPALQSRMFLPFTNFITRRKKILRDQKIRSYIQSIEKFTHMGRPWVEGFVGEVGEGVIGFNDELRRMV